MKPRLATLTKITSEAANLKGFTFALPHLNSHPGQFVMLWLPGIDQKPFSLAADDGKTFTTVVFKINVFTAALFKMKLGDKIGVTGPFGHPFTFGHRHHVLAVGGGYGAAPLAYLIREAKRHHCSYELLIGARTKKLLLYTDHFPKKTFLSTDDGSMGYHGYITEILEHRLKKLTRSQRRNAIIYVCGPEPMEYQAAVIAQKYKVSSQISVERYMKCGFGICGQCCVDDTGEPMCQVGPVISGKHALSLVEFGKYYRDKSGMIQRYGQR